MTQAIEDEHRLAILQAERLGLVLPQAAVAGVVANQRLLTKHYAVVRDAVTATAR